MEHKCSKSAKFITSFAIIFSNTVHDISKDGVKGSFKTKTKKKKKAGDKNMKNYPFHRCVVKYNKLGSGWLGRQRDTILFGLSSITQCTETTFNSG